MPTATKGKKKVTSEAVASSGSNGDITGPGKGRTTVSDTEFVNIVKKVAKLKGTLADVAAETGLPKLTVSARMARYRKAGVNLPSLTGAKRGRKLNVDGLNKLLEQDEDAE